MMEKTQELVAGLKEVRQHHEFTRDRIGQPGCRVRQTAAEHVERLDTAIEALATRPREDATGAGEPTASEIERAFRAGHAKGRTSGSLSDEDDDWQDYATALSPAAPPAAVGAPRPADDVREAMERIIDPNAWTEALFEYKSYRRISALDRADAILAKFPALAQREDQPR